MTIGDAALVYRQAGLCVLPAATLINHALRHVNRWLDGDDREDHLANAAWNLCSLMHFEELRPDLIDVPTRPRSPEAEASG